MTTVSGEAIPTAPATGAAAGATPAQTTPVSPAADPKDAPPPPATGDPEALGDAGKRAIDAMKLERDEAKRLAANEKKRADDLELAAKSDTEKAIAQAKIEGSTEATQRLTARIAQTEAKAALIAAGVTTDLLDLAVPKVAEGLKVNDAGEVDGLETAIAAVKTAYPGLFTKPDVSGSADGGVRGKPSGLTKEKIQAMTPAEYEANRAAIFEFMAKGT